MRRLSSKEIEAIIWSPRLGPMHPELAQSIEEYVRAPMPQVGNRTMTFIDNFGQSCLGNGPANVGERRHSLEDGA